MNTHVHSDDPDMGIQEGDNSLHGNNTQPQNMHPNDASTVPSDQLGNSGQSTTLHQPVGNDWANTVHSVPSLTGTMSSSSAHDGSAPPPRPLLPETGQPLTAAMLERWNRLTNDDNVNMRITIKQSVRAKKDKASATRISNETTDLGWVSQPTPFDSEVFAAGAWSDMPRELHDACADVGNFDDGAGDFLLTK